jgi:hypothetical protein
MTSEGSAAQCLIDQFDGFDVLFSGESCFHSHRVKLNPEEGDPCTFLAF